MTGLDAKIFTYSKISDFEFLWNELDRLRSCHEWPKWLCGPVLIEWGETPLVDSQPVFSFVDFLTPYDWAVALTAVVDARVKNRDASQRLASPPLKLFIWDRVVARPKGNSLGLRLAGALSSVLPFLHPIPERIQKALSAGRLEVKNKNRERAIGLFRNAKDELEVHADSLARFCDADWEGAAMLASDLWRNHLSAAKNRHSVSNAVGPSVLAAELARSGFGETDLPNLEDNAKALFLRLLDYLGIFQLPSTSNAGGQGLPILGGLKANQMVRFDHFGRFQKLRFFLVDDNADEGFHHVLAQFLLNNSEVEQDDQGSTLSFYQSQSKEATQSVFSLQSRTHPGVLLQWLENSVQNLPERWHSARIFGKYADIMPGCSGLPEFDVLFLDLRLFEKKREVISGAEEERAWLRTLISFYERIRSYLSDKKTGIAKDQWVALEEAALGARKYCENTGENDIGQDAHISALALLPILISVCDPTMPVVLFSSSQQRKIIEILTPFPNIKSQFIKPNLTGFLGQNAEEVSESIAGLQAALKDALQLHEDRILWEYASMLTFGPSTSSPKSDTPSTTRYSVVAPPCKVEIVPPAREEIDNETGQTRYVPQTGNSEKRNFKCQDLPFPDDSGMEKRFFDLLLKHIHSGAYLDTIGAPFSFLEACLLARYKKTEADRKTKRYLRFNKNYFNQKLGIRLANEDVASVQICKDFALTRNLLQHGFTVLIKESSSVIRALSLAVALQLIYVVSPREVKQKIAPEIRRFSEVMQVNFHFVHSLRNVKEETERLKRDPSQQWMSLSMRLRPWLKSTINRQR